MGVDYRVMSGYGFAISELDFEEVADRIEYKSPYDVDDGYVDGYELGNFITAETEGLVFDYVGDHMNGDELHLVIIADESEHSIDFYGYAGSVRRFDSIGVTDEVRAELERVHAFVFGDEATDPANSIGWLMATTVS